MRIFMLNNVHLWFKTGTATPSASQNNVNNVPKLVSHIFESLGALQHLIRLVVNIPNKRCYKKYI